MPLERQIAGVALILEWLAAHGPARSRPNPTGAQAV